MPRDLITFEAIQRHWWLPSHYLFEFTKHLNPDMFAHRRRLAQLVKERLLRRPEDLNNPRVKNDFLNYALTPKSEAILRARGLENQHTTYPGGGFAHAAMTVAVTANIDLEATRAGFRYITQEEIIAGGPAKDQKQPLAIPTSISYQFKTGVQRSDRPTVPDQLFGIDYGTGCRFFAVEADRGTETISPNTGLQNNSILRKLLSYKNILDTKAAKKHFGIPNFFVLIATTSQARADSIIKLAKDICPSEYILVTWVPGFDYFFKSPPLLPRLWSGAWERPGKEPFYISKP